MNPEIPYYDQVEPASKSKALLYLEENKVRGLIPPFVRENFTLEIRDNSGLGYTGLLDQQGLMLNHAEEKSGKTRFMSAMRSAAISNNRCYYDHPDKQPLLKWDLPEKYNVVSIDNELSRQEQKAVLSSELQCAGFTEVPPWYHFFSMRGLMGGYRLRMATMVDIIKEYGPSAAVFFIDVGTKFVSDTDHKQEASQFWEFLANASVLYNFNAIVNMHSNRTNNKSAGPFGNIANQNCSMITRIDIDKDNKNMMHWGEDKRRTSEEFLKKKFAFSTKHGLPIEIFN